MHDITIRTLDQLRSLAEPSYHEFLKKMVPSKKEVLGIKAPQLRIILTHLKDATNHLSNREKIDLAIEWVHTNVHEMGQLAYEYVGKDKQLLASISKADLVEMNFQLDNWASVDTFGVYIHGKAWRTGILSDEDIMQMVHHDDFWQRRLAVVSTIPLNQQSNGGKGDPTRTFMICNEVVSDYTDLVVKALSWALRELSKREPLLVHDFLDKNKAMLHKRVSREVNNKLTTGKKNT
jgi:3-methyladenine DNA glycosylase AlkD